MIYCASATTYVVCETDIAAKPYGVGSAYVRTTSVDIYDSMEEWMSWFGNVTNVLGMLSAE